MNYLLEFKCKKIEKVKNYNIFNILYNSSDNTDDDSHFNETYKQLEDLKIIFNVPEELNISLSKIIQKVQTNGVIEELIDFFEIDKEEYKSSIEKLSIFLQSEKYLKIIQHINYFIKYTENIDKNLNKDIISYLNGIEEYLINIKKYNYGIIIDYLKYLDDLNLFDYSGKKGNEFVQFCEIFYTKEAAISLLIKSDVESARILQEKFNSSKNILIEDIDNFISCINYFSKFGLSSPISFKQFMVNFKNIMKENKDIIKNFRLYCDNYSSIMELDSSFEVSQSGYHIIKEILDYSQFEIKRKEENFSYLEKLEDKIINIKMGELIEIKNDIFRVEEKNKNKIIKEFGDFVDKLNNIISLVHKIRSKGCPVNIEIKIEIKKNNIKYYLKNRNIFQISDYEYIINYLFKVINELEKKYNEFYKSEKYKYIRYIYGEQFFLIVEHLNGFCKIKPFLEYCLNDSFKKEGLKINVKESEDVIDYYDVIIKNMLENVSKYMESFFENNGYSLEDGKNSPYNNVIIKEDTFKGIYKYKCEKVSIEEDIIDVYLKLTGNLPIAQNILKCNEETLYEEMFSFFHRAILCNFHTLFVIEINDSLTNSQNNNIFKIIEDLIKYKEKKDIKSLILFVYQNDDHEIIRFISNINENIDIEEKIKETKNVNFCIK